MEEQLHSEFILELFRLSLHDRNIQNITIFNVQENWLPLDQQKRFLLELRTQVKAENRKPSVGTLKLQFRKDREMLNYIDEVMEAELRDPETILKALEDFIRQAMFLSMYSESAKYYNKGDKTNAFRVFSKTAERMNQLNFTKYEFDEIFSGFHKRQIERLNRENKGKLPTGIDELDYRSNGGPEEGEFWLFVGPAKSAKSQLLISLGVNYARRGEKVMHIQAEGTRKQVLDRYDACWTGSKYTDIKNGELDESKLEKYENVIRNIGDGEIFIYTSEKFNSMTMLEVRQKAINLKKTHPDLRVILIDYLDLINPDDQKYTPDQERHRQQATSRAMKDLARELNVLVVSVTQTSNITKECLNEENFVISEEHLAEDKGKVRPVDALISINRTKEERIAHTCRLHLAAMREHDSEHTIKIVQNLSRVRFYDRRKTVAAGFFHFESEAAS